MYYNFADCKGTDYHSTVTAVPFRECDDKNMGVSLLCDLTGDDVVDPPIYGHSIRYEYDPTRNATSEDGPDTPDYVKKRTNNIRKVRGGLECCFGCASYLLLFFPLPISSPEFLRE